jgi:glycosyltransferase involved in cell wall biosynthesis
MRAVADTASAAARGLWLARNRRHFRMPGPARKPRLLVDVSVIKRHDAGTGIQRVVRSVWSHLNRLDSAQFEVIPVHAGRTHGYCIAPDDFLDRAGRHGHTAVGARAGDKFLGLDLAAHYLPFYTEQLAAWRTAGTSLHFVVYDLLPLTRPDWFKAATTRQFEAWLAAIMSFADQALCISDEVAHEFRRRVSGPPAHRRMDIGRLYLSGDIAGSLPSVGLSPQVSAALERALSNASILMIGTIEPRKGFDRVLDAFERLWASRPLEAPDLIVVGKRGWKTAALQDRIRHHIEHGRRLHWLEEVSDEALTRFYDACLGVVVASYDEGFGLPLVEASIHRRWALARDLPVFREHRLSNARYFSDDSPEALSRALLDLVRLAKGGHPPVNTAPKWSWCVDRLIEEIGLGPRADAAESPLLRLVS